MVQTGIVVIVECFNKQTNAVVDQSNTIMAISQGSRVVLPALMVCSFFFAIITQNNHDQSNSQAGLETEMVDPISGMYTSMDANALSMMPYANQQFETETQMDGREEMKENFELVCYSF